MRKLFLTLAIIVSTNNSFCQSTSIKKIIDGLSWHSYDVFKSFRTFFVEHNQAYSELIKDKKQSSELLFKSIDDPNKTVSIHILLTQIFEPDQNFFLPVIDFYNCYFFNRSPKQLIGHHFIYNGLVWETFRNGENSISKNQIERIKQYWDLRLHQKGKLFDLEPDEIIKEVHQNDAEKYSCHDSKIYENNSSGISVAELQSLIGSKYPGPLFDIVFNKLGNDSTVYYRNDTSGPSYISYKTDGIDFNFDDRNVLQCIFINPLYKGLLFNNLKMSDTKEEIKRKLGEPKDFTNIPRYKYDWIYEKYKMLMAFGYANRIIDLQINNGVNP